ncbi:MAG: monovalent cation/H+ antiporter subunit D family protein [Candidatus Schekmanbacteria bacterium]|nr:monovalent cation/H+ antiporter subunit D family protein [Candidatus Schekmanbacteria bacterium]
MTNMLLLTIFLPFVITLVILLLGEKRIYARNGILMAISIFEFVVVLSHSQAVLAGKLSPMTLADLDFFTLTFNVDPLSLLLGSLISFLWIFTTSYSIGYMSGEHALVRYFSSLTVCLGATMGIIFSANLMTFFIFYEILTIAVYPLVIHEETEEAYRAGVVYMVYLLSGGTLVFFGIILTYYLSGGNITFTIGGIPQLVKASPAMLYLLLFLFSAGFGVKAAIIPLHVWLPRAMVAPTPVSALLHAVAVVNMGLYAFIRMIYNIFGPALFAHLKMNNILAVPAVFTIILAAIAALRMDKIKKLLAYSTINQLSYVILGASSLHPIALLGALVHLVYHSVMKITLFYSAGTIIKRTGKTKIREMSGLAKTMPVACAGFAIGALGISGLPPIAGWVSKWYFVKGFLELERPWLGAVFIISTILEIGFFAPPVLYAYFGGNIGSQQVQENKHTNADDDCRFEAPLDMLIPLAVVTILSVTFGLFGSLPFVFGRAAINSLLPK